jgi:hypothetical protein
MPRYVSCAFIHHALQPHVCAIGILACPNWIPGATVGRYTIRYCINCADVDTISASGRSSAGIGIELTVLVGPVGGCIAGRERYICFLPLVRNSSI